MCWQFHFFFNSPLLFTQSTYLSESASLTHASDSSAGWLEVLTSVVVPGVRRGLKQSTDTVKKGFVSLLAYIVDHLGRPTHTILEDIPTRSLSLAPVSALTSSVWTQLCEAFHSDLFSLRHEDPEQDFFENINHIQLHRRVRAFAKLRSILKAAAVAINSPAFNVTPLLSIGNSPTADSDSLQVEDQDRMRDAPQVEELPPLEPTPTIDAAHPLPAIGIASMTHVLLPLALHPLVSEEFKKKDHLTLLQESAAFVGTIGMCSSSHSPVEMVCIILESCCDGVTAAVHTSYSFLALPSSCLCLLFLISYSFPLSYPSRHFSSLPLLTSPLHIPPLRPFIGLHLPWTQYFALIKTILKQLDRQKAEKEKVLLAALCSVLDSFHFEFEGDEEAEGIEVPALSLSRKTMKPRNKKLTIEEKVEGRMRLEEEENEGGSLMVRKVKQDKDGNDVVEEAVEGIEEEEENKELLTKVPEDDINENENGEEEEVEAEGGAQSTTPVNKSHTIARAVVNSVMPWVKVFLLKEEKDHKGNKSKTVRPMVALALTKLISRLHAPVVSEDVKSNLFSSLVIRVVDTLRSRDSAARDAARESLAKMVLTMGLGSLNAVLYELQHSLTEGYQRHVCNYTIRYLLTTVLEDYSPPTHAPSYQVTDTEEGEQADFTDVDSIPSPVFDQCIPMIIISVLDDLNGVSSADRGPNTLDFQLSCATQ